MVNQLVFFIENLLNGPPKIKVVEVPVTVPEPGLGLLHLLNPADQPPIGLPGPAHLPLFILGVDLLPPHGLTHLVQFIIHNLFLGLLFLAITRSNHGVRWIDTPVTRKSLGVGAPHPRFLVSLAQTLLGFVGGRGGEGGLLGLRQGEDGGQLTRWLQPCMGSTRWGRQSVIPIYKCYADGVFPGTRPPVNNPRGVMPPEMQQPVITLMITGINTERAHRQQPQYVDIYGRLHSFIENINQKIVNRIQLVQHTYLDEYKQHMKIMTKELNDIKGKIDEARMKERANEKMFLLEEERDYFRFQVGKLDGELRKVQQEVKTLKKALAEANDEINNYKKICFKLEENATKLKSEVMEIYSVKQSDMARTVNTLVPQTDREDNKSQRKIQTSMPRARSSSSKQFKTLRPMPIDLIMSKQLQPNNQLQEILTECVKEMKKEIFYRNLKPQDLQAKYFEEDKLIAFDKFSKSDKKELLYRFLGNPDVLDKFYNFVFEKNDRLVSSNLASVKPFDDKYNKASLFQMRKKFEQRIRSTKIRKDNYVLDENR